MSITEQLIALMTERKVFGSDGKLVTEETLVKSVGELLTALQQSHRDNADLLATVRVLRRM